MSCTETTSILGITDQDDELSSTTGTFYLNTRSVAMGRVISDNTKGYLGRVIDPETGSLITATYATQFYCMEDYQMPPVDSLCENDNYVAEGIEQWCDSCEVRLYLEKVYGEDNNPLKLEVYMLSDEIEKMFNEDSVYHTDYDLMQMLPEGSTPIASRVITSRDYMITEAEQNSSNHQDNIVISLPASLGQKIMESYYDNPNNFSNAFLFTHKVFPGLLFRIANGEGTMLTSGIGVLNMYYDYKAKTEEGNDTIYRAITRFAATPEIIQSSSFSNTDLSGFIGDEKCTYLKTPAGIATEVELPIEQILQSHPNDSISLASVTFNRYNKSQGDYELGTPQTLLMVRKKDAETFFKENHVINNRTSYLASFNASSNSYTFNNIGRLLSTILLESQKEQEPDEDWNKVLLLPVVTSSNSNGNITSVSNEMSLTSIRLKGGPKTAIPFQIVFTRFE